MARAESAESAGPATAGGGVRVRDNAEWVRALTAGGADQAAAIADLRAGMLGVIRACLARRMAGRDHASLAEDCAQEALLLALQHLPGFRGESRFTTWAYQIAIRQALAALRRRDWQASGVAASLDDGLPARILEDRRAPDPERALQQAQVWTLLQDIIQRELTPRQRTVLVAGVFRGMPLDLVAESLGTTRDNVYKLLHDARRSVQRRLLERRVTRDEILEPFRVRG